MFYNTIHLFSDDETHLTNFARIDSQSINTETYHFYNAGFTLYNLLHIFFGSYQLK